MREPRYKFIDGRFVDTDLEYFTDADPETESYATWCEVIVGQAVCDCIAVAPIVHALARYLKGEFGADQHERTRIVMIDTADPLQLLVASLASEQLGLTEHAGNIRHSWLSDAGKRWMELYERDGVSAP